MSVGIVGLGYVGLPLAVAFAEAGEHVVGVDISTRRVAELRRGESYIEDITDAKLQAVADRFQPTTRIAPLAEADAIIIFVPTPPTPNPQPGPSPPLGAGPALAAGPPARPPRL